MAGLMSNQGEEIIANLIVNKGSPSVQNLVLKLFKNNYTPVDGSTEANFTEATFNGYASVNMSGASWTVTPNAPTLAEYPQQTFTVTSLTDPAELVYGYYIVQATSGKYMWGERFSDGPYVANLVDDNIKVTAKLNLKKAGE